jgi:hypothetical protein
MIVRSPVFSYRKFEINISRVVELSQLAWPDDASSTSDSFSGWNNEYVDLRGMPWDEAARVFLLESELIRRIELAADVETESDSID